MADGPNHDLIERLKAVTQEHREMHIVERDALFAEAALALIEADKQRAGVLKALGVREPGAKRHDRWKTPRS